MATQKAATKSVDVPAAVKAAPVIQTNAPPVATNKYRLKARELGTLQSEGNTAKLDMAIFIGASGASDPDLDAATLDNMINDFGEYSAKRLGRAWRPLKPETLKKDRSNFKAFLDLGRLSWGLEMLERIEVLAKKTGNSFTRGHKMAVAAKKKRLSDEKLVEAAAPEDKDLLDTLDAEAGRVEDRVKRERAKKTRDDATDIPLSIVEALDVYGKAIRAAIKKLA